MGKQPTRKPVHLDIVDTNWTFAATALIKEHTGQISPFAYGDDGLKSVLQASRDQMRLTRAEAAVAFVSVNHENKSQLKFPEALEHRGFVVELQDFRHNFIVSTALSDPDRFERGIQTHSPSLAYLLGSVGSRAIDSGVRPDIVVVSGAFELYYPLRHLAISTGGRTVIAYFKPLLDHRWHGVGLFDDSSSIGFIDLSPHSTTLLAGADIIKILRSDRAQPRSGISTIL